MRDLVKRRKSEVRYSKRLSNGQLLNIYFWRNREIVSDSQMNTWNVGLIITENRKQANNWFHSKWKKNESLSTGNCGLEGLKKALEIVLVFRDQLAVNEILFVRFADDKRMRAYRWLTKHDFEEYFLNDEFLAYGSLNPERWDCK